MKISENRRLINDVTSIIKEHINGFIRCEYPEDYFESKYDVDVFKELDYPQELTTEIYSDIEEMLKENSITHKYSDCDINIDDIDCLFIEDAIYDCWDSAKEEICNNMEFDGLIGTMEEI